MTQMTKADLSGQEHKNKGVLSNSLWLRPLVTKNQQSKSLDQEE